MTRNWEWTTTDKIHVIFMSVFLVTAIAGIGLIIAGVEHDQKKWTMIFNVDDGHDHEHKFVDGYEVTEPKFKGRSFDFAETDLYPEGFIEVETVGGTPIHLNKNSPNTNLNLDYSKTPLGLHQGMEQKQIVYNDDGTKLYFAVHYDLVTGNIDMLKQYDMSTPYDKNTALLTTWLEISHKPIDIQFHESGTVIYLVNENTMNSILQCTTAWEIETCTDVYSRAWNEALK